MKTSQSFRVHFVVRAYKAKNGKAPLFAAVTVNKEKCLIGLKESVPIEMWDVDKGYPKGTRDQVKKLSTFLEEVRLKLGNCYKELQLKGKFIDTKSIKSLFLGEKEEAFTLSNLMSYHNETATSDLKWSTLKHYYVTQRYLKKFLEEYYKATDIYLRELNYKFVKDFEVYLRNHKPKNHQKPLNNNGVMKHIIRLKKMTNLALNLHWIDVDPFATYKLKMQKVNREQLSEVELKAIEEKKFGIERLEMVRDMFVFCCYTGLSYVDVSNLEPEHIVTGADGDRWIRTCLGKTLIMQGVCAALRKIFENRSLPSFRASLYEWLEIGLSNQPANEFIPTAEMIPLYDTMQKLFVIAWLLNYGIIKLYGDKGQLLNSSVDTPADGYRGNSITLYQLDKDISLYKDTVIQLVGMIKEKVSTIKAIFCLGEPPVADAKIYLYILAPETEEQRAQNLVNKIEDICRPVHTVVALVHHQWHTSVGFDQDDLFVANAMNSALVYLSGDLILPVLPPLNRIAVADKATYKWSRWYKQGNDLLKGAEFYISCGVSSISLFSLQQAAEAYLIGIIKGVMGYKLNTHSLTRLLYITEMFTQDIKLVFADLDKELFDELRNAYLNVRFRD